MCLNEYYEQSSLNKINSYCWIGCCYLTVECVLLYHCECEGYVSDVIDSYTFYPHGKKLQKYCILDALMFL